MRRVGARRARRGRSGCSSTTRTTAPSRRRRAWRRYDLAHYDGVLAFGDVIRRALPRARAGRRARGPGTRRPTCASSGRCAGRAATGRPRLDRQLGRRRAHAPSCSEFLLEPVRELGLHGVGATACATRAEARARVARAGLDYRGWLAEPPRAGGLRAPPRDRARAAAALRRRRCRASRRSARSRRSPAASRSSRAPWDDAEGLFTAGRGLPRRARRRARWSGTCATVPGRPDLARALARRGRRTILARHTCAHRVDELLAIVARARRRRRPTGDPLRTPGATVDEDRLLRLEPRLGLLERRRDLLPRDRPRARTRAVTASPSTSRTPTIASSTATSTTRRGRGRRLRADRRRRVRALVERRAAPTWSSRRAASASSTTLLEEAVLDAAAAGRDGASGTSTRRRRSSALEADAGDPFRALMPRYDLVLTYGGGDPVVRALPRARRARLRPGLQRARPGDAPSRCARPALRGRPRVPRQPAARPRGARRGVLPARRRAARRARRSCSAAPAGRTSRCRPTSSYLGHVVTADHNAFNCTPLAVLNVPRDSMARNGWSPATRVFEAAGAAPA